MKKIITNKYDATLSEEAKHDLFNIRVMLSILREINRQINEYFLGYPIKEEDLINQRNKLSAKLHSYLLGWK